jgi:monoamine oxidase
MPHPSLASRSVLASQPTSSFQLLSTQAPMTDVYDCIVIGAGWSGVVAARSLARAGNKVVILEARDRVGGRARTYTDAGMHAPIDLGCSWIHGMSLL